MKAGVPSQNHAVKTGNANAAVGDGCDLVRRAGDGIAPPARTGSITQLERDALAMTPTGDENLTGHWHARQETDNGYVSWGVQLEQHGISVSGLMQCKFAGAYPLTICGILEDGNLTATWSRPHKYSMGSGIVHLTLSSDGNTLTGTTKWYNAENPDGIVDSWYWGRSQINTYAETRQNNAVNPSGEVGPVDDGESSVAAR